MTNRILPLLGAAAVLALAACGGGDSAETPPAADTTSAAPVPATATPADTTTAAAAPAPAAGAFLDPNSAPADQLLAIPGFDQSLADAVVAGRPYADMTGVETVLAPRLSEVQRDTVYNRLWKPMNPNTATRDEILLVPGVGPKMAHEFEEYRPWTSAEQFRREIGKYVDEAEVARLERYIAIP
jgi:DNA uptake protein ComE-like DNA-binding protein